MIYVAMAALALIISGVSAARAATQFCDIYPERCQYSGNGVYYYYPQGYRVGSAGTSSAGGTAASSVAVAPCGHATKRTLFFIASGRDSKRATSSRHAFA